VLELRRAVLGGRGFGVGAKCGTDETRFTEEREGLRGMLGGAEVKKEVESGDWRTVAVVAAAVGGIGRSCGESVRETGTIGELLRGGVGMRGMGDWRAVSWRLLLLPLVLICTPVARCCW
jgi:hypothetical protein